MKEVLCSTQCSKGTGAGSVIKRWGKWPGRFRFKIVASLLLGLITLASLGGPGIHTPAVDAQSTKARYQQDLAQVFTNHEDVQLDPVQVSFEFPLAPAPDVVPSFTLNTKLSDPL